MVIRVENGNEWEEAPYTEEEKQEMRRRLQGVVQVMHRDRTIVPQPPRPPKNDPSESKNQSQTPAPKK